MINRKSLFALITLFFLLNPLVFCESEGEKAFKGNKPESAVILLEEEIESGTASPICYNYLGLAYYQLGEYKKSAEVFATALTVSGTNKKIISYNQGNSYFAMGEYENAAKSFSLTLTADSKYTKALINRANAYLMAKKYAEAISDYEKYIILEEDDEQRPKIEELLELLKREKERLDEEERIAAEEAERAAEEERKFLEEMERQRKEQEAKEAEERRIREEKEAEERRIREEKEAEERRIREEKEAEERRIREEKEAEERRIREEKEAARKAAEAERRRKLLEDVANSLQKTDLNNMSAGSGDLLNFDYEAELD
ncbi:MAG: tetratricopeptide repeat protein [Treponema sp.]|nr:tetratricopeptide repeat protein [Treponema sp.]